MQYKIHMTAGPTMTIDESQLAHLIAALKTHGDEGFVKLKAVGDNETYVNPVHIVQIQIQPSM